MRGRTPMTCRRWITIFFATWAVLSGLLVLLAGVALNLPFRKWLLPYLTYCACGIVLAPALYWAGGRMTARSQVPCGWPRSFFSFCRSSC